MLTATRPSTSSARPPLDRFHPSPHQPQTSQMRPVLQSTLFSGQSSSSQRRLAQDLAWHWVGTKWARLLGAVGDRRATDVHVRQAGAELQATVSPDGKGWALAVSHRERDGGRTWMTRAQIETQPGADAELGVFSVVTACTPMDEAPRVLAPPGVLQLWVDRLGLDDGGVAIVGEALEVSSDDQLNAFFRHVLSPQRRLPIVALCHQPRSQYYGVDPKALATAVRGIAHVACFTTQTCLELHARWGTGLAPVAGAARLYPPGFATGMASAAHDTELAPLWCDPRLPGTPRAVEPGAYRRLLCQRLCALSLDEQPAAPVAGRSNREPWRLTQVVEGMVTS